ncbi:MAG: ribonuclease R [Alphaproteobacteria bacterium]
MPKSRKKSRPFPSREDVIAFMQSVQGKIGKREIAREFGIAGSDRPALKELLREMEADGQIERTGRRALVTPGQLPAVFVGEITEMDDDVLLARPVRWPGDGEPPVVEVRQGPRRPSVSVGDRALLRVVGSDEGRVVVHVMRRFERETPGLIIGEFGIGPDGPRITSSEKRGLADFAVPPGQEGGAVPGDLVEAEVLPGRRGSLPQARVKARLGALTDPGAVSLIAIRAHDLPTTFPDEAVRLADAATVPTLGDRVDLRNVPLVTIDGEDARDFDDAVFAEADGDGWRLLVAIADVAWYVRPNDPIDREARKRGNSVYLPDRVLPMLPEALSNGVCSLRPKEPRAVLAIEMRIDGNGTLTRYAVMRGLMRSAARLTYTQVQAAMDGTWDDTTGPLAEAVLEPLFGAYQSLLKAREARGVLGLNLNEKRIVLDEAGRPVDVLVRSQDDSNRLIEEFMIAANVAAASTLEADGAACMYRVHDMPSPEKIEQLRATLRELGLPLAKGQVLTPEVFNRILDRVRGTPDEEMVNMLVLRSQAMAEYSPRNIGHFGLSLVRYAHFTSPIRRYADLLVHRALITTCELGEGGEDMASAFGRFEDMAPRISAAERRAQAAERDTVDRYMALYLGDRVGQQAEGRIRGVSRAGLFVGLDGSDADGFIPISTLPRDYYEHDPAQGALIGERTRRRFRLGDRLVVRIREANPLTGGIILELLEGGSRKGRAEPAEATGKPRKGKPVNRSRTGQAHPPRRRRKADRPG